MTAITSFCRRRAGVLLGFVGLALAGLAVAFVPAGSFSCAIDDECGPGGTCQQVAGFCSFGDSECPSGQRYGEHAGDLANECVGASRPGTDDTTTGDGDGDGDPLPSFEPSNFPASLWSAGSAPIVIDSVAGDEAANKVVIDTEAGTIQREKDGASLLPEGAEFTILTQGQSVPDLAVFSATGLTIDAGVTVTARGSRALVFAIAGDVQIGGMLKGCGESSLAGPGGFEGGTAVAPEGQGPGGGMSAPALNGDVGGGGAGHISVGGKGGRRAGSDGGDGGGIAGNDRLMPLMGGSGGGAGGGGPGRGIGGGGGGALQISATRSLVVAAGAAINVGGGGGGGGGNDDGGGGGGAGGAVLLEASSVLIAGTIAANGGGGGAGANETLEGASGEPGGPNDRPTPGGGRAGEGAAGGQGGAGMQPAGKAGGNTTGVVGDDNAGGGGGAGGRIRLRAASIDRTAGMASPMAGLTEAGLDD